MAGRAAARRAVGIGLNWINLFLLCKLIQK